MAMKEPTPLSFRADAKLRDALFAAAKAEHRSVTGQILLILEQWLIEHGYLPTPKGPKR
jgi:hypothetical protein